MNLNWNNVRSINGSQNEGFEELVCQLAAKEIIAGQTKFYRVGKPDGGKECFWVMGDGNIRCWQAKYFTAALLPKQWSQVDESVRSAVDNHHNLTWYGIAIPIDRPDTKVKKYKSSLEKWNDKVVEWKTYAAEKGMAVDFEFWGSHEMITRLNQRDNEGLRYFWFNELELTDAWFERKNMESINMLGNRYTPELNFNLPIAKIFNGLSRNQDFEEAFHHAYDIFLEKFERMHIDIEDALITDSYNRLQAHLTAFNTFYHTILFKSVFSIPATEMNERLQKMEQSASVIQSRFLELREVAEKEKLSFTHFNTSPYTNQLSELEEFFNGIDSFRRFIASVSVRLSNKPLLLLTGRAGIGKSHMLADLVQKRRAEKAVSLLLLGENFTTMEMPWTQILKNQLRLSVDEEVFLAALNAKAESASQRIVVFIDAINEGEGRRIWPRRLLSFIQSFAPYPWLGLVISLRDSFQQLIAPENEFKTAVIHVPLPGFLNLEYEASVEFFKYYKINPPGTPLLHPEFQNPLFLKLFCLGLEKRRLHYVPEGYEGITAIVDFYIESVEMKLSQPDQLDYDVKLQLVKNSVLKVLDKIAGTGKESLLYIEAEKVVSDVFLGKCLKHDLYLNRLISEGIFDTDMHWSEGGAYEEGIHFAYQRFHDHLLTSALLERHLDPANPVASFQNPALKKYIESPSVAAYHQNIIEALAIQLPEKTGKELHEIVPHAANYRSLINSFTDSLLWRKPDTITRRSEDFVKKCIQKHEYFFYSFLDTAIALTSRPNFYFNADWLHTLLFEKSMPQRDLFWTAWLQDLYGKDCKPNSVKRLIDWAWQEELPGHISLESVRLAATTLAWFLTSVNRYLRDSSTKALVCLLQDRIDVLIKLLQSFEKVNDPYIYERLFAVCYGCTVRTTQKERLVDLSEYVYQIIFNKVKVYPHILLRDYARSIIEYTQALGFSPAVKSEKIQPPYKSYLPEKFPTIQQIDRLYKPKGDDGHYNGKKWGAVAILDSMTTEYGRGTSKYGDFGRYTFESALRAWDVDANALSNYAVQRILKRAMTHCYLPNLIGSKGQAGLQATKSELAKSTSGLLFTRYLRKFLITIFYMTSLFGQTKKP